MIVLDEIQGHKAGLDREAFYGIGPECEEEMGETDDRIAYCLNVDVKGISGLNWAYSFNEPMLMGEIHHSNNRK